MHVSNSISLGWGCRAAGWLTVFAGHMSVFTLTIITIERYFAITRAIYLKTLKIKAASYIMICGWLYSIAMAILPLFGISNYSSTRCVTRALDFSVPLAPYREAINALLINLTRMSLQYLSANGDAGNCRHVIFNYSFEPKRIGILYCRHLLCSNLLLAGHRDTPHGSKHGRNDDRQKNGPVGEKCFCDLFYALLF